jgi:aminoglycoside 6'-N-acetyltransferase I
MRQALWPDDPLSHAREIEQFFTGAVGMPVAVLIALQEETVVGFAELSIRNYAEDCVTDRVGYLEGWYVVAEARRQGVGRALVEAAENWARSQGCREFGSDAVIDNEASAAAHLALGFVETAQIRCFRKPLEVPPHSLQIFREFLVPGREAAFREIEEDAARICAQLGCPNAHLAIESLAAPTEIWWLTPYHSESDKERVAAGYASNPSLLAALQRISERKIGVTRNPEDVVAVYSSRLSRGIAWEICGARFFVALITEHDAPAGASVFEAPDGTRFVLRPTTTLAAADEIAALWGESAKIFAVRPYWGMPAPDWIAADPEFWKGNRAARIESR